MTKDRQTLHVAKDIPDKGSYAQIIKGVKEDGTYDREFVSSLLKDKESGKNTLVIPKEKIKTGDFIAMKIEGKMKKEHYYKVTNDPTEATFFSDCSKIIDPKELRKEFGLPVNEKKNDLDNSRTFER